MAPDFGHDLKFSRGTRELTDLDTLKAMIPGCVAVEKTGEDLDRRHVDYVAHLRRGAVLHIDGKTRRGGAKQYWRKSSTGRFDVPDDEPDLAIEIWSVVGDDVQTPVTGWTLDESSDTDLILYSFDPADTNDVFLLSFPLLRIATRWQYQAWMKRFGTSRQTTERDGRVQWHSECCLVPAVVVQNALRAIERGEHKKVVRMVPKKADAPKEAIQHPPVARNLRADEIKW